MPSVIVTGSLLAILLMVELCKKIYQYKNDPNFKARSILNEYDKLYRKIYEQPIDAQTARIMERDFCMEIYPELEWLEGQILDLSLHKRIHSLKEWIKSEFVIPPVIFEEAQK